MSDTIRAYDTQAGILAAKYDSVPADQVHAALLEFIPRGADLLALDVGAGSGRDAAWLAADGFEVVAVEPAAGMRAEAMRRHPDPRIRWLDDYLPDLSAVHQLGLAFDLILLSAVWMHVPPPARERAFRKLVTLLKPGGVLLMSLREGPSEPDRPMWPAPAGEVEALARVHGLAVLRSVTTDDRLGRPDVRWTGMCLRLPDDGVGALPLLRGIILNNDKSSTYKLGLLRAVARIADTTPALAVAHPDIDAVEIPLGLVALNWVRMYLPPVSAGLPQMPGNAGPDGLGFAKAGFRELLASDIAAQDLRIGANFVGERAAAVARALAEARRTIASMPANYITFPNSDARVFTATPATPARLGRELMLDDEVLRAFGTLTVPGHVWRTLQRLGVWVEPVLVGEWSRLMRAYGERMSRPVGFGEAEAALAWLDPVRDTQLARVVAQRLLDQGRQIILRLDRRADRERSRHARHRPLPAVVRVAVRGPLEPAARYPAREPAPEAGSAPVRRGAGRRADQHHGVVGRCMAVGSRPARPVRARGHRCPAGAGECIVRGHLRCFGLASSPPAPGSAGAGVAGRPH